MFYHCINATKSPNSRLFQPQILLFTKNYRHQPQNAVGLTLNCNKTWPLNNRLNKSTFLFLNSSHSLNIIFPSGHFRVILGATFHDIFSSFHFQLFPRMPLIRLIFILIDDVMMIMIFLQLDKILVQSWANRIDQDIKNTFIMATWKWIILSCFVLDEI